MDKLGSWRMTAAMTLPGKIGLFVVLSGQSPQTLVLLRGLIGAPVPLGWLAWRGQWKPLDARAALWLLLGGAALIGNWLLLFSSPNTSPSRRKDVVHR